MRLRATVQLRNEYMLSARKKKGLTQADVTSLAGVSQEFISILERLNFPAVYHYEKVLLIADVLEIKPEQVMPEKMAGWKGQTKFSTVANVPIDKLLAYRDNIDRHFLLKSPDETIEDKDDLARVKALLSILSFRERAVIKLRYGLGPRVGGPYTLLEIANRLDMTRERVRVIEAKALRHLQQKASSSIIMEEINKTSLDKIE